MSASADSVLARELATEATALHLLEQHDAALQTVQRLEGLLPEDPAVQHNLVVAGWYADAGFSLEQCTEQLRVCMQESRKQEGDDSSQTASTVAAINYAILLFLQQQHAKALEVLEPLYTVVDTMHGGAALCLCVLLLEIYLSSQQFTKAAQVLHYLQGSMAPEVPLRTTATEEETSTDAANGSPEPQQGSPRVQQQHTAAVQQSQKQLRSPGQHRQPQQSSKELSTQQLLQQQEDAAMRVSLDLAHVSRVTSPIMQEVQQLVAARGGSVLGVDVPAVLHTYKARLAMACGNFKAAKKEVRGLLSLYPDSHAGVLLKSELEVLRQQPKKALKTLAPLIAAPAACSTRSKLQLLTLLAAIHQQLGKHHVATLYLSAALEQQQQAYKQQQQPQQQSETGRSQQQQPGQKQKHKQRQTHQKQPQKGQQQQQQQQVTPASALTAVSRTSHWLLPDSSDALQYNLGLQQLLLGNWQAALECFETASSSYYNRCAVWLRLAEATISLYHQQQQQQLSKHVQAQSTQQQAQAVPGSCEGAGPIDGMAAAGNSSNSSAGTLDAADGLSLLQQAAQQLSTGLALLQDQQAEAAKQAEVAAAAMSAAAAAAAAAGDPLPVTLEPGLSSTLGSPWSQIDLQGSPLGLAGVDGLDHFDAALSNVVAASSSTSPAFAGTASLPLSSPLEAYMLPPDVSSVQQALLANQAYVQLLLHQPAEALAAAQALLACSSGSTQYHYLGSCYAAEALLLLGRSEEAAEQLQGQLAQVLNNSGSLSNSSGFGAVGSSINQSGGDLAADKSSSDGFSLSHMQGALLANLSSVMAAQGDAEGSRRYASTAIAADPSITASRDVLFLSLQAPTIAAPTVGVGTG